MPINLTWLLAIDRVFFFIGRLMQKLFITGVTSNIGCYLANYFSKKFEVTGSISKSIEKYDDLQKIRLNNLKSNVKLVEMNLKKETDINNVIDSIVPDYMIHHAGYAKNYGSFDFDYEESVKVNVEPLSAIYDSLHQVDSKGIIITGTCMEYSDSDTPHEENEICKPATPYGKSKLAETLKVTELSKNFKIPTRVIRLFNPYGGLENSEKLIPYLLNSIKKGRRVDLTSCEQVRNFIHIDELMQLYEIVLNDLVNGGTSIYNGVSEKNIRLKDFLISWVKDKKYSKKLLNFGVKKMHPTEVMVCAASCERVKNLLKKQMEKRK